MLDLARLTFHKSLHHGMVFLTILPPQLEELLPRSSWFSGHLSSVAGLVGLGGGKKSVSMVEGGIRSEAALLSGAPVGALSSKII